MALHAKLHELNNKIVQTVNEIENVVSKKLDHVSHQSSSLHQPQQQQHQQLKITNPNANNQDQNTIVTGQHQHPASKRNLRSVIEIYNRESSDFLHASGRVPFFSMEYFPPKYSQEGLSNLLDRIDRMSLLGPSWVSVTWGSGTTTAQLSNEIATHIQSRLGLEVMMHLTATNAPTENLRAQLDLAKKNGIRSILACRGEPPKVGSNGFAHAIELVRFIRKEYGNHFSVVVAGYPEGHPESGSRKDELNYLKQKVDAGADMIITQFFYDIQIFLNFVSDCRAIGINVPIVPGMMPIQTYNNFKKMIAVSRISVPQHVFDALEPIKANDESVKAFGIKLVVEMCKTLMGAGFMCFHFYTLNLEKAVTGILEGLEIHRRHMPWLTPARDDEAVRPIFWAHRPQSYLTRTATWDEFPNGRWGDARSPAFGELTDYHVASLQAKTKKDKLAQWGEKLSGVQDVYDVFSRYCEGKVAFLPWSETPLLGESYFITDGLVRLNKNGFLTINSQPKVNGVPSTHDIFGWGPPGGYIYQKAYLEFFISPQKLDALILAINAINNHSKATMLTYHAVNLRGKSLSNTTMTVNAISWGVFPSKEILQPTVVDPNSFLVWKDEAFGLWHNWSGLYEEGTESRKALDTIVSTFYLVNVVDNDYVNGNIFDAFDKVIQDSQPKPDPKTTTATTGTTRTKTPPPPATTPSTSTTTTTTNENQSSPSVASVPVSTPAAAPQTVTTAPASISTTTTSTATTQTTPAAAPQTVTTAPAPQTITTAPTPQTVTPAPTQPIQIAPVATQTVTPAPTQTVTPAPTQTVTQTAPTQIVTSTNPTQVVENPKSQ